jgi:replicative DNA helicase Mcm
MSDVADCSGFLKNRYIVPVLELGRDYPDRKTLIIDFIDFYKFDNESGNRLLDHPDKELAALRDALRSFDLPDSDTENLPDGQMQEAEVAIRHLPDSEKTHIYKIGQGRTNKLISIEGRITRIAPKYQKLVNGAFRCARCSDITFWPQPDERYMEPFECGNDSCGRKGPFKLIHEESDYEDQQKIGLQDLNECMKPGQPLREIIILIRNAELIQSIPAMGAQCTVTGIARLQQKPTSSIYHTYIEAIHIEPKETEIDLSISEAEKREFRELAASCTLMQTLTDSTAPEILGYANIKVSLLCSIVSGGDNIQFRDYTHIIICGDPSTGKSALLKFIRAIVPRAQYSAGRGSSVAGLTVAIVKDELSGSGYTAQAGALVLADRGLMVLDEVDKLEKEDIQALNTALEEGFIEIHKGGINKSFNTRCPVIALCNPKNIRFDFYDPLSKQIGIPADTLSRFDLIFKIQDIPNPENDRLIAEHQAKQWARNEGGDQEQTEGNSLPRDKLSKYLQYAKTMVPHTTPETRKAIIDYYLTLRKVDETGMLSAAARQNNGLYRLTKSMARLRLSETCNLDDVEKAIQIHQASLEALRDPKTGKIDVDIAFGLGKSQRVRLRQVMDIIRELQGSNGGSPHFNDIISKAEAMNIKREYATSDMQYLKHAGEVIEVSNGRYRVV